MPPEAAIDVASAASIGLLSNVSIPVLVAGKLVAILAFGSMREERAWPDELVARMRLLAQAFGSALARKHTQDRIDAQQALEHLADIELGELGSLHAQGDIFEVAEERHVAGVDLMCNG